MQVPIGADFIQSPGGCSFMRGGAVVRAGRGFAQRWGGAQGAWVSVAAPAMRAPGWHAVHTALMLTSPACVLCSRAPVPHFLGGGSRHR